MREYGKVQTDFWEHAGVRRLSTEGRLLYLYLLTGPHTNMAGCFKAPAGYIADDLGWVSDTVSKGFAELSREGFASFDEISRFVLVHGFLKFNQIANPKMAIGMMKWFREVPDASPLKPLLAGEVLEHVTHLPADMAEETKRSLIPSRKPYGERYAISGNREQGTESREEGIGTSSLFGQPTASTDPVTSTALVLSPPTPAKPSRKKAIEPTPAEQSAFDTFWAVYPRKAAKKPALDAYLKAVRTGADVVAIQSGAEAYAQVRAGEDSQTTKLAAGWIRDCRWEDEVSPRAANQNSPGGRSWSALDQAIGGMDLTEEHAA